MTHGTFFTNHLGYACVIAGVWFLMLQSPTVHAEEPLPDVRAMLLPWMAGAVNGDPVSLDVFKRFGPMGIQAMHQYAKGLNDPRELDYVNMLLGCMGAVPRSYSSVGLSSAVPAPIWIKPKLYLGVEYFEAPEEFCVWLSAQPRRLRHQTVDGPRRDPIPGLTYVNIIASGHFYGDEGLKGTSVIMRGIDLSTSADHGIVVNLRCDGNVSSDLVEGRITDLSLTEKIVELQRSGQSIVVRCLLREKETAPVRIVEEIVATGGGLSRLDSFPNLNQLKDSLQQGDKLAVRRYLKRELNKSASVDSSGVADVITGNDPVNSYWATRLLAKNGRAIMVSRRMESVLNDLDGPVYPTIIACYLGLIDDGSDASWKVVLNPILFDSMCATFNQYSGELVPDLIGQSLSNEVQINFRNAVGTWTGPMNSQLRMMAWILSKCPGNDNIDSLVSLYERSKDDEVTKLVEGLLMKTVAIPVSLDEAKRGGVDVKAIADLETSWYKNAQEITRWWRGNRQNLVWDSRDGMYRLVKVNAK